MDGERAKTLIDFNHQRINIKKQDAVEDDGSQTKYTVKVLCVQILHWLTPEYTNVNQMDAPSEV